MNDEHIKEEASAVLASMGLTVSDAFRMLLTRIAKEHALPFEPLIPNQKTKKEGMLHHILKILQISLSTT
ncbi:type II toxin-antitoxin system RelB/DinJ family antitoxin [Legionella fairfieldensis]|uniref:type II toxin-antitoxin system RelB/DinJ family antitoxin n=1 Tax=Legionella fairfieldensis TaxID=45064 RepID=UPI000A062D0C|nr:type II toxin-antitoxin system RelB/DinJ family antitoxin [Legionella fairfieldensis]